MSDPITDAELSEWELHVHNEAATGFKTARVGFDVVLRLIAALRDAREEVERKGKVIREIVRTNATMTIKSGVRRNAAEAESQAALNPKEES